MRVYTLKELIDVCSRYSNNEINFDEFKKILEDCLIMKRLSLKDKVFSSMYVLFECEYTDDLYEKFITLEMNKFWYIILRYCGISVIDNNELCTEENYELLYNTIYNAIMTLIKDDYDDTMRIFDNIISYTNFDTVFEQLSDVALLDPEKIKEVNTTFLKDLKDSQSLIQNLADVMKLTNQEIKDQKKDIEKQVIKDINNK